MSETPGESLEHFARSLSYGTRSDLSFKYLTAVPAIGDALASLLREVGATFDTADPTSLIETAIRLQAEAYRSRPLNERYRYSSGPFAVPRSRVSESRVALLTSSGHFMEGDDPKPFGVDSMTQAEAEARVGEFLQAEPSLSEIPITVSSEQLRVRHGGYDVRGVLADHNVAFPIDRLLELEASGAVGGLHETAYSFVGAAAQTRIIKQTGPQWAEQIAAADIDVVLLVPV